MHADVWIEHQQPLESSDCLDCHKQAKEAMPASRTLSGLLNACEHSIELEDLAEVNICQTCLHAFQGVTAGAHLSSDIGAANWQAVACISAGRWPGRMKLAHQTASYLRCQTPAHASHILNAA